MLIEYSYYDLASNDAEFKENLKKAIKYPISSISVLPFYIKSAKTIISNNPIRLSTVVDYPLGINDLGTRLFATQNAIKAGVSIIEITLPTQILSNRKYEKFREDVNMQKSLCVENNIELRYILEYRVFSYEVLYKIVQILKSFGISNIYPSTGYLLDDIYDNILAAALITKKTTEINTICNGNVWNSDQVNKIKKMNLYGIKVNSLNALEMFFKN